MFQEQKSRLRAVVSSLKKKKYIQQPGVLGTPQREGTHLSTKPGTYGEGTSLSGGGI